MVLLPHLAGDDMEKDCYFLIVSIHNMNKMDLGKYVFLFLSESGYLLETTIVVGG